MASSVIYRRTCGPLSERSERTDRTPGTYLLVIQLVLQGFRASGKKTAKNKFSARGE